MEFTYAAIPEHVTERTKFILLDTIGAILAATSPKYDGSRIIIDFIKNLGGKEESSIFGRPFKTSCVNAALANGTMGYYCDIESHHATAILHAPAVLVPTILAVGERENVTGMDIITALILGVDIEARISFALSPTGLYARGFHPSAVCGSMAASVAAGKLLNLSSEELKNAIGLSACQASGLLAWESDKTEMSRPFQMGVAARNGVTSALLAQAGFGGPEVFEGKYNIFTAFSGEQQYEELTQDLGIEFEIANLAVKRYACCAFLHPGLDALLHILEHNNLTGDDIQQIILRFPKSGALLIDNSPLKSHNAQYILAVAAYNKRVMIDDILLDPRDDPKIFELINHVDLVYDAELDQSFPQRYDSIVEVKTKNNQTFQERVNYARGTPENLMTTNEIHDKFHMLTKDSIDEERRNAISTVIKDLENLDYLDELTKFFRFSYDS
jgi:2-methylcitrate dehydratase PrpD